jgi:predicted PhzF superfamily epimerase YddE/YHI9
MAASSHKIGPVPELHVLRVFVNEEGEWGNPLGVFLDGGQVPEAERQRVATELGFSETVYVEDRERGRIRIFTPGLELPFAGHPSVGSAWLLAETGTPVPALQVAAGEVAVRVEGAETFIAGRPEWSFEIDFVELDSPAEVRALDGPPSSAEASYAWAWIDEAAGTLRSRCFVEEAGIAEDEATGAAAVVIGDRLGRPLTIHQGHGSVIAVRPLDDGRVEIGGGVRLDEVRDYPL